LLSSRRLSPCWSWNESFFLQGLKTPSWDLTLLKLLVQITWFVLGGVSRGCGMQRTRGLSGIATFLFWLPGFSIEEKRCLQIWNVLKGGFALSSWSVFLEIVSDY
jgi:hypothetical protein